MPESDVHDLPTTSAAAALSDADLAACVGTATAAPSIHNSQPWRFRLHDGGIDVFADRGRRLDVVDPSGRELMISIGAALFNLRLAIRVRGWVPESRLFPDPAQPDLVARVRPKQPAPAGDTLRTLAAAVTRRHTNRLPFAPSTVPVEILEELVAAATLEGATLTVAGAVARNAILSLVRTAERRLASRGIYRAELAGWTRPVHGRADGVPPTAFGPWDALETMPLRDFGLALPQLRRAITRYEPYPTIVVLSSAGDQPEHWVTSGQALQRTLLVATTRGLAATPLSQPLEIPELRALVTDPDSNRWAQLILRLGYAPDTAPTPRRPLTEVLDVDAAP